VIKIIWKGRESLRVPACWDLLIRVLGYFERLAQIGELRRSSELRVVVDDPLSVAVAGEVKFVPIGNTADGWEDRFGHGGEELLYLSDVVVRVSYAVADQDVGEEAGRAEQRGRSAHYITTGEFFRCEAEGRGLAGVFVIKDHVDNFVRLAGVKGGAELLPFTVRLNHRAGDGGREIDDRGA